MHANHQSKPMAKLSNVVSIHTFIFTLFCDSTFRYIIIFCCKVKNHYLFHPDFLRYPCLWSPAWCHPYAAPAYSYSSPIRRAPPSRVPPAVPINDANGTPCKHAGHLQRAHREYAEMGPSGRYRHKAWWFISGAWSHGANLKQGRGISDAFEMLNVRHMAFI